MKEDRTNVGQDERDDLTLRDLILAYRRFQSQALRNWWLYGIAFLIIGGILIYRAVSAPETYPARLTFMVNEDDGNPFGGLSGVLGTFGLGRRGGGGRFNLDKIVELARSRKIIQQVILTETEGEYLGNRLIAEYQLAEQWAEATPEMEGFRFTRDSVPAFNEYERTALLALHGLLVGGENAEGLIKPGYNDISSILYLTVETTDEALSIDLARTHFEKLSEFYVNQAIERQQETYDLVRDKVDSIQAELSSADHQLAVFEDASQSMWSSVDRLKGDRLRREIIKLSSMQAEAVKNMEFAEFSLKNAKPVIQEVDLPIAPLQPEKPSLLKAIVIGGLIAFVIVSLYLIGRNVVRDAMRGGEAGMERG